MATIVKYQPYVTNQFGAAPVNFATGGDTIKVMLTTATYTPSAASDTWKSAVSNEVTGGGYTARGATVTTSTSNTGGTLTVTGTSVTWAINAGGFTNARYAVIYKDTGSDATSPLIGYIDLGANQSNVNGSLILNWNNTATSGAIFTVA